MPTSSSFESKIILVVDDEPAIVKTLVLIFNHSKQNLFAIGSTDIAEALGIVHGIRPDLVLLDVQMPGAKGLAHAVEMRDTCGCKILLMSGQTTTAEVIDEYIKTGNAPFEILPKPIHPTVIIRKVQQMLADATVAPEWKNPLSFNIQ